MDDKNMNNSKITRESDTKEYPGKDKNSSKNTKDNKDCR